MDNSFKRKESIQDKLNIKIAKTVKEPYVDQNITFPYRQNQIEITC